MTYREDKTDRQALEARDAAVPQLVAEVYEAATQAERSQLIAQLLRPLGLLSLVAVADGVFAKIRLRSGWQDLNIRLEDLQNVRAAHVVALVDHAQQVSVEAVDGLARVLINSPLLTQSAAAMLLVPALVQRARLREAHGQPASSQWDDLDCVPPQSAQGLPPLPPRQSGMPARQVAGIESSWRHPL